MCSHPVFFSSGSGHKLHIVDILVFAPNGYDICIFILFIVLNRNRLIYWLEDEILGDISALKCHQIAVMSNIRSNKKKKKKTDPTC